MIDDSLLSGLDPYGLLDREADRLDRYFSSLDDGDPRWQAPTRCEGWTVRDLLAHLAASEEYHHAGLDDALADFFRRGTEAGATDLDGFNTWGIRSFEGRAPSQVLEAWRSANEETRRRMRERDGDEMATTIGPYPVRRQAFHVAAELATHADDVGVPVTPEEADARCTWRARFSHFALLEEERNVDVIPADGAYRVRAGGMEATLSAGDFVEAVAARLPARHPLRVELRDALGMNP
jgi:uncharacterized protein (TIGR03083 family)